MRSFKMLIKKFLYLPKQRLDVTNYIENSLRKSIANAYTEINLKKTESCL
jgi:hypothetical protein